MKLVVRTSARADILLQVVYLCEEFAMDAAVRFPDAVDEALEQIRRNPGIGAPKFLRNPKLSGLRSWPVQGFEDIRVYYLRPEANLVRVLRILHGKRDLGRILERDKG